MATVRITNVSPLGDLDVPILGRIVAFGETVVVDAEIAGAVPDPTVEGDLGIGLLAQFGNFAPADPTPVTPKKAALPIVDLPPIIESTTPSSNEGAN